MFLSFSSHFSQNNTLLSRVLRFLFAVFLWTTAYSEGRSQGMEFHRSSRMVVAGDPWTAPASIQVASSAAQTVSRCSEGNTNRPPRWTLAQQRGRSRHQDGRGTGESGEIAEGPRCVGKSRNPRSRCHQEISAEGSVDRSTKRITKLKAELDAGTLLLQESRARLSRLEAQEVATPPSLVDTGRGAQVVNL